MSSALPYLPYEPETDTLLLEVLVHQGVSENETFASMPRGAYEVTCTNSHLPYGEGLFSVE